MKIYCFTDQMRESRELQLIGLKKEMHLGIKEDDLFPEPSELRGIMAQLEALLELVDGNTKIQSNSEAA